MKYALYPNTLKTGKKNTYLGKVQSDGSYDLEKIIEIMCRPGTGLTKAEATGVLTEFFSVIEDGLIDGNVINLPMFKIKPSIQGVFVDMDDKFNDSRHKIVFNISKGKNLEQLSNKVRATRVASSRVAPVVSQLMNPVTNKKVDGITPGMLIEIKGKNFRLPEGDDTVGVFLITGKQEIRLKILAKDGTGSLLILLPDKLSETRLQLKVVTQQYRHKGYLSFLCDLPAAEVQQ